MENDRGTVERIVRLIGYLATVDGDVSVKSVADALELPQSTAHRLVQQLVSLGLMQRAAGTRRYEFGAEMYRLGAMITNRMNLVQLAAPSLHRIVQRTNEGCALGLLREQDHTLVFAAHVESPQPLRYRIALYDPVSILWGASGRSVLSFLDADLVTQLGKAAPRSPTGQPSLSVRELKKEIETIRAAGYAVNRRGEKIAGASGISAPIFGSGGRVLGCLSLTIPSLRYPAGREEELGRLLMAESAAITGVMTGRAPQIKK